MQQNNTPYMSADITKIAAALSKFQGEVKQPELNKANPFFKSRYVDLSGVLATVQTTLSQNGLAVAQILNGDNLITLLTHSSGQWLRSICPIGTYKTQQDRGSAITYTKRYAICAMLGIASDIDDDGNAATTADKKKAPDMAQADENIALAEAEAVNSREAFEAYQSRWLAKYPQWKSQESAVFKKLKELAAKYPKK